MLGNGATVTKGGLVSPAALAANRWFIDLHRTHHVCPPSAPTDGFLQTVNNMKAGRTAMTIHHVGSANDLAAALGDGITAMSRPARHRRAWLDHIRRRLDYRPLGLRQQGCGLEVGVLPVHGRG